MKDEGTWIRERKEAVEGKGPEIREGDKGREWSGV